MRCISLWQPWASLWCSAVKVHETRKHSTKQRGWVAVHAAKAMPDLLTTVRAAAEIELGDVDKLPRGAIVGAVCITDSRMTSHTKPEDSLDELFGNWAPGRHAWRRGEYIRLELAVPWRGQQGMFRIPEEILFDEIEQLRGPRCHILDRGLPLCGFSIDRVPAAWPNGHRCVSLDDRADASCLDCLSVVRRA